MFLPDINFWLALTFEVHAHHVRAKQFFDSHPAELFFFCRFTQQGFLRIASNATVFGEEAVSLREGWHLYDRILTDSRVSLIEEPNDLEQYWRSYMSATGGLNAMTDAEPTTTSLSSRAFPGFR
jgi:predicted nucleic acid-binding protein